eukprot:70218_1
MATIFATALSLISSAILFIHSSVSITKKWNMFKSQKVTVYLAMGTMLCFPFCMTWCLVFVSCSFLPNKSICLGITFYGIIIISNVGEILLYLFFFSAIHYSFPYNYSIWFKIACIIIAFVIPLARIIIHAFTLSPHISVDLHLGDKMDYGIARIFVGESIVILIDNILLWSLSTFLFGKCLYRVALNQIKVSDENDESAIQRAKRLMQSAVRHAILMLVVIIFSIFMSIIYILIWTKRIGVCLF